MGSVFESFLYSGFNFTILQSDGSTEYFIDKLQTLEKGLAKTVAPSFKNLPDYPAPQLYFHPNPEGVLTLFILGFFGRSSAKEGGGGNRKGPPSIEFYS